MLLGVWQQYSMKLDGEDPPAGISQVDTWEFKEDTVGRPESPFGTWNFDPTRSPKHFQFQLFDKGPRLGLYELEGDHLTLCYGTDEGRRPSTIKAGYGTVLLKFRRDTNFPNQASDPIR
ncbi:MAG TPA: TIGR03067 domain-containing protein [Pirellulaceae bacterium]|nr:TIGR03067 domain-containing protein [Pirellulaceae bacterium]